MDFGLRVASEYQGRSCFDPIIKAFDYQVVTVAGRYRAAGRPSRKGATVDFRSSGSIGGEKENSMMPLISTRNDLDELEFLKGLRDKINTVYELHSSEEDDTAYTFVIWPKNVDDKNHILYTVEQNIRTEEPDGWETKIYDNGTGILIVTSVLTRR